MCRLSRILVFFLLTLSWPGAEAQRYNLSNFTSANGLPGNQVNKILQDRSGRLWIGTMNGACYYDGKVFTGFEPGNILNSNPVKSIFEDQSGNIWFGTIRKGLVRYYGTGFNVYTTGDGLLSDIVNAVCQDRQGNIWIGTSEGLSRFDGKKFTHYTTAKGLVNNNVFDLHIDHAGRLWIATIGGVSLYDGRRFTNYTTEFGLISNIVYSIHEAENNQLWFSTYEGVSIYDGSGFRSITMEEGLPNERVEDLLIDRNKQVWFGTYGGGLAKLQGNKISVIRLAGGVNGNIVKSLLEDREGNYWLGTWNGLYRYNGDRFLTFTTEDGLSNNNLLAIYADKQNKIWMGTLAGGVNIYNGSGFEKITVDNGLKSNTIWSIYQDYEGYYWFGTTNGPARYKEGKPVESPFPELQNLIIYSILQSRDRQHYYFGTDKGVYRWDGTQFTVTGLAQGLANDKVRVLYEDPDRRLWIGTLKGVYYLDGDKAISFEDNYKLPKAPVTSIINDQFGQLLISSYDFGVIRYNARMQTHPVTILSRKNGLNSNRILFNFLDRKNVLWLGTSEGIDRIDWDRFIRQGELKILHYEKSNGYLGVESNAACEDTSGNIWFATVNGAIRYLPQAGDLPGTLPKVTLRNIQLFFENVDWKKKGVVTNPQTGLPVDLVLPYNNNHVSFICNGIYLTAPDEVQYRYMLEGQDEDWSPPGRMNIASYSNLSSGSYLFKVQASANGRDWSNPVTYEFSIRPPIWRTPFFYLLYIVLGAGSIMLAYRIRTKTLRINQDILRKKVEDRTRELQEKNKELAKLSLVASETDNAVMIFDNKLELEWVNSGFVKLTGYTLSEIKKLKGSSLNVLSTNKEVLAQLEDCIREKKSIIYESEIVHKNGSIRWASSTLTPILNEQGQLQNIAVIDTDITLRKQMEEQIRANLEEKGVLLREIHHRVKNNLQIIISLFNLQTSFVQDKNAYKALKEGQDRIKSMALIHERFYQSDGLSRLDFDDYVKRLTEHLFSSFRVNKERILLEIKADRISLDIDTAVPCGLIINEIVSNSLKHAFGEQDKGVIRVELSGNEEGGYRLIIGDNGRGFPNGFNPETADSLGIQLIQALTDQLEGTMKIETGPGRGTTYTINFKRIS